MNKPANGGKRPGAGRKPNFPRSARITLRISTTAAEFLRDRAIHKLAAEMLDRWLRERP